MDLSPERVGTFDVVLFVGVLYHLRHPLLALERVASVSADLLVFDSHTAMSEERRPVMLFYPGTELNDDPDNWWGRTRPSWRRCCVTSGSARSTESIRSRSRRVG